MSIMLGKLYAAFMAVLQVAVPPAQADLQAVLSAAQAALQVAQCLAQGRVATGSSLRQCWHQKLLRAPRRCSARGAAALPSTEILQ